MPKGPRGQKRPADINKLAARIVEVSTGDAEKDDTPGPRRAGGLKGGKARAKALSPQERKEIAKKAAKARWQNRS